MSATAKPETSDYEVGYRRPPKQHQFTRGVSGNPSGRAKGSQNFETAFRVALNEKVTISIEGERKVVPRFELIAAQLATKAASGVFSFLKLGIEHWRDLDRKAELAALVNAEDPDRLANDNEIMKAHNLRVVVSNSAVQAEKPASA